MINTISGKTPTRERALEVLKIEASKNEVVKELLTRLESPEFTPDFNQIYDTTFDNYASLNRESTKLRFQNEFHASFQNTIHRLKELNLSKKGIYFKDLNEMSTKRFMASDYKSQTDVYEKETSAFEDFKTSTDTVLGVNTIEDMLGVTFYKEVLNELLNEQTVSSLLKNHLISFRQYLNRKTS